MYLHQCCVEDGQAEDKAKDKAGQSRSRPRPRPDNRDQGQGLPVETVRGHLRPIIRGQGQGRTGIGEKSVANLQISTRNTKYNI